MSPSGRSKRSTRKPRTPYDDGSAKKADGEYPSLFALSHRSLPPFHPSFPLAREVEAWLWYWADSWLWYCCDPGTGGGIHSADSINAPSRGSATLTVSRAPRAPAAAATAAGAASSSPTKKGVVYADGNRIDAQDYLGSWFVHHAMSLPPLSLCCSVDAVSFVVARTFTHTL